MASSKGGGGPAAQAGFNFQDKVATWFAVRILAEKDAAPLFDLSEETTLTALECETGLPVDDLLVHTLAKGFIFAQVKHSMDQGTGHNSEYGKTIGQFVKQFVACLAQGQDSSSSLRPLDPERDRLVMIVGPGASSKIRSTLPTVLKKVRDLPQGKTLDDLTLSSEKEKQTSGIITEHIKHYWKGATGNDPQPQEILPLLVLITILELKMEVGVDGESEREAKDTLRSSILKNADDADAAWSELVKACAEYGEKQSGADRQALQKVLTNAGIDIKGPRSYRDDIEKLHEYSKTTLEALQDLSRIKVGGHEVIIERPVVQALKDSIEDDSLLIVGEPGAGKSGSLYHLVDRLINEKNRDVVFLAVDRLEAQSLGALRNEIGLQWEIIDVLRNWPGTEPGFLIIDALDAARSEHLIRAIQELIERTLTFSTRWKVVVSIRKFDLRYNRTIQQTFSGTPPSDDFIDGEFNKLRHTNIPALTDDELGQIDKETQIPELMQKAGEEFRGLLRNPFNLSLIARLIDEGVDLDSLTGIKTQIELLDRYWKERVIRNDGQGDAREELLQTVSEAMVRQRSLRIRRDVVRGVQNYSPLLLDVLHNNVLAEWPAAHSSSPNISYSHHVLFDYAAARLLLRREPDDLIKWLKEDTELIIVIRPSLVMHFKHLWELSPDHSEFWDLVFKTAEVDEFPQIGKILGPTVAAELMEQLSDCGTLLAALEGEVAHE